MNKKQKEKWQELYSVMNEICAMDPWGKVTENAIFIYNRKDGKEIYYRILGEKYGYYGIACYVGLENYLRSQLAMKHEENGRYAICLHDALICLYDDNDKLSKEDKAILKELGIKCRGKGAWLHFNSYTSGHVPAQLTDEELADFADALGNLYMMMKAAFKDGLSIDFEKAALIRFHKKGGKFPWYNMVSEKTYESLNSAEPAVWVEENEMTEYYAKQKTIRKDVGIMFAADDTKMSFDDGSKGYGALVMMIDMSNGKLLNISGMPASVNMFEDINEMICDVCDSIGKPKRFICDDRLIEAIMADFLEKIGSELVYMTPEEIDKKFSKNLKNLNFFDNFMLPDDFDDSDRQEPEITAPKPKKKKTKKTGTPDNTYVLSVSIAKGCYRHIAVSGRDTLEDLSDFILEIFDFENDHMHAFFMDNKPYSDADAYYCRYMEEDLRYTDNYNIGEVLRDKQKFLYIFDFGDDWEFDCRVLRIQDEPCKEPRILRSVGKAPEQYPDYEDEEYDEYDEEDEGE